MKIKDIAGFPKEQEWAGNGHIPNRDFIEGFNSAISLIGEGEIDIKELMKNTNFMMMIWGAVYASGHTVLDGPSVLANKSIEIADKTVKALGGDSSFIDILGPKKG